MNIDQLLEELTIEEKCHMLVGQDSWHTYPVERLNIPSVMMADGPHGLRKEVLNDHSITMKDSVPAVCFPPAVTVASSFDPLLAKKMGRAIAREFQKEQVSCVLGPGLNIKRSPLCGRNFEYYSEDPIVAGEMAKGMVEGIQSEGVSACIKHFAFNNQETMRMNSSSILDERAKHEIYLKGFDKALEADPGMVMCSYNLVDHVYASENRELLQNTLRDTFGFKGLLVSDWTAVSQRSNALKASLDLEMPHYDYSIRELLHQYKKGNISIDEINRSVKRILEFVEKYQAKYITFPEDLLEQNHQTAIEIAAESMVLLKNEKKILPLKDKDTLAIIGAFAENPRIQGGGSSHIHVYKKDSFMDQLSVKVDYEYAPGYTFEGDGYDADLIKQACKAAANKDKVLLFIGLTDAYESEGYDRTHLSLPLGHEELLSELYKVNSNIIVILQIGSPVIIDNEDKCKAILNAYLGGEGASKAIHSILYGEVSPSGRLAETFPLSLESNPVHENYLSHQTNVYYKESIYVGYRYYCSAKQPVLYPFGYGLSYATFEYSNLVVDKSTLSKEEYVTVSVDITNTSKVDGKEVVLLFIKNDQSQIFRPIHELKKFAKVFVHKGETVSVSFRLTKDDFTVYDEENEEFVALSGNYEIEICKNAEEVLYSSSLTVEAEFIRNITQLESYQIGSLSFEQKDFESLIHNQLKQPNPTIPPYTINSSIADMQSKWIGRILKKVVYKQIENDSKSAVMKDDQLMIINSVLDSPLRSISIFSGGMFSMKLIRFIVALANHQFGRAIKVLFKEVYE